MSIWSKLKQLVTDGARTEYTSPTFSMVKPEQASGFGDNPLVPNECYVSVTVSRMHTRYSRILTKEYYPLVHSAVSLSRIGAGQDVEVPFVTGAADALQVAEGNEGVMLVRNVDILPPTPYIGGTVSVAMALCAAAWKDYVDNLVAILGSLSGVVGGSALTSALNVVTPLQAAAEDLLGLDDLKVVVGVANEFHGVSSNGKRRGGVADLVDGHYVLTSISEDQGWADYFIYSDDGVLRYQASDGTTPGISDEYIVFSITQTDHLPNWERFSKLNDQRLKVEAGVRNGLDSSEYLQSLQALKEEVGVSADLLHVDRVRIVESVVERAKQLANAGLENVEGADDILASSPDPLGEIVSQYGPSVRNARAMPFPVG